MDNEDVKNNIDEEFSDMESKENKKYIPIVIILYCIVIVLVVLLILGLKKQKDVIKNNNSDNENVSEIKASDYNRGIKHE